MQRRLRRPVAAASCVLRPPRAVPLRSGALDAEQAAFAAADCTVAMGYFADWEPLFVVSGRTMNRPQLVQMCTRMAGPRPGPPRELVSHAVHVLSAGAAFSVTHYSVRRPGPDGNRSAVAQVVTKVWVRIDDGWRIAHLHESIAGARPPG